jgi:hypothetical protein
MVNYVPFNFLSTYNNSYDNDNLGNNSVDDKS